METIGKKDFVEILFTGTLDNGDVFDSNIPDDLKKATLKVEAKPFIFCIGEHMFLEAVDNFLIGKEIGKEYSLILQAKEAFGERNASLVKVIPLKLFLEHQTYPQAGMTLNIDGNLTKIISVSGGRVVADFNHPLSGKVVHYKLIITKKITDIKEKAASFIEFLTKQKFDFDLQEKEKKIVVKVPQGYDQFFELFKDKFREILDLELTSVVDEELTKKLEQHKHNHAHEGHDHSHHDHEHR